MFFALTNQAAAQQTKSPKTRPPNKNMETQKQTNHERLIDDYFQTLNEPNEKRRFEMIQKIWATDAVFVSPVGKAAGHQAINEQIQGFQRQSPGARVRRIGAIETLHDDYLRFDFEAVAPDGKAFVGGVDFAAVKNGKLQTVAGFFDAAPKRPTNQTAAENINLVKGIYKAFNTGDYQAVLGYFAPTIEWISAESSPLADASPYRGLESVRNGVFARIAATSPELKIRADEIFAVEEKVVALGYYYDFPQKSGAPVEAQVAHVWTILGGRIVKFQQYTDTRKLAESNAK